MTAAVQCTKDLTAETVASEVLKIHPNGPIIVGVDEIASLSKDLDALCEVLSTISGFIKQIDIQSKGNSKVIAVVTALPATDLGSVSGRQPIMIEPVALDDSQSVDMLKKLCPEITDDAVKEICVMCGGHPRSLAVAATMYNGSMTKTVPTPENVAAKCLWKVGQGVGANAIAMALGEAYVDGDASR